MALSDHAFPPSGMHGHLGPFIASDDDLFIVGFGGVSAVEVLRSTDDGSTWGTPVATTAGRNVDTISAAQSGDTLYVAWTTVTYTSGMNTLYDVEYREFSMASNAWSGSVDTVDSPNVTDQGLNGNNRAVGIVRRSSDTVILYQGSEQADMGTGYSNVSYARGTAGSWSSVDNLVSQAVGGINYYPIGAEPSSQSGECHFFWKRDTAAGNQENARTLQSGNTLSTSVTGTSANGADTGPHALVAWDDAGTWRVANMLASSTSVWVTRWNEDGSNDIAHTDRQTSGINDSATATSSHTRKSIAVDPNGDDVYVLWDGTGSDLFYDVSADAASGGWGTDVEAEDAVTVGVGQSANGYTRGASTHVIGYIFDNDATGNTVFGEISTASGLTVGPVTIAQQLATGVAPQINMTLAAGLEQQLLTGVDPYYVLDGNRPYAVPLTSGSSTTSGTSVSTASITPTGNRLVLACVDSTFSTTVPTQPTASGNGLTWVVVRSFGWDDVGTTRRLTLFRAMGASPTAGAVTFDFSGESQTEFRWGIVEFPNVPTTGSNGADAVIQDVQDPASIGSGTTIAAVLSAFGASGNVTFGVASKEVASDGDMSGDSNMVTIHDVADGNNDSRLFSQWVQAEEPTVNWSYGTSRRRVGFAVEIAVDDGSLTLTPALLQQLAAAIDPSKVNMQIQHSLVQQLVAGVDPSVAALITAALAQQLAAGVEPSQLWRTVAASAAQQLAAGIDPALALVLAPALEQQLVAPVGTADIEHVASSSGNSKDITTMAVPKPTGIAVGDALYVWLATNGGSGVSVTPPAGWTELTTGPGLVDNSASATEKAYLYRKIATSTETAASTFDFEFAIATNRQAAFGCTAFRNVDQSTPEDASIVEHAPTGTSTTPDPQSITTVTDGAFVLCGYAHEGNDGSDTVPTGYTRSWYDTSAGDVTAEHTQGGVAFKKVDSAGAEDPGTFSVSTDDGYVAFTVAVRPASTGGGPKLNLVLSASLVQQLLSPFDPEVAGAQFLTPVLASQTTAGIDPQVNMSILAALAQQLAAGTTPVLNLQVLAALAQQLTTGVEPQVNMSIIAAVLQQFAAGINPTDVSVSGGTQTITDPSATQLLAGIDPQLNLAFQTALVTQTLQGIAPQLNITIDPALEQQLAAGVEPSQLWRTIVTALEQQLAAGVEPSVAFGITTALVQQLAAGITPSQLDFTLFPAVGQQLAAGVEPSQLSRFVVANLVQQLAAGVDPTVLLVQAIQAALAQQLLTGIEPTQLYLELFPALLQQLAAGIDPTVSLDTAQTIDPAVLQQLIAGLAPTQLDLQLIPAIAQQLAAAVDPSIAVTLAPVLAQQLATGTSPEQLNLSVLAALVEQLAVGVEPSQFISQIVPAILQQLVAAVDPSVAFGITPTIVQQLVAANTPQLNMAIATVLVQQLLAGLDPALNAIRIVTSGGVLTVSVVDGRLAVTSVEGSASASPNTEG